MCGTATLRAMLSAATQSVRCQSHRGERHWDDRTEEIGMELEQPLPDTVLARLVVEFADAVIVADAAGRIRFWNGAAERIFGWTAAQALGSSLDLIIPERQRTRHWDGYRRVMSTGTTKYGSELLRVPSLHSDGTRRSIAFTVTLLKDAHGTVTGIAAVVRDETERWNQEQELRRLAHGAPDASSADGRARPS
jgi:PAS domain S-box-containing protein